MLETAWDLEIKMRIPFTDLVFYPHEVKDEFLTEPSFQKIADYLNIKIDITELYEDFFIGLEGGKMNPSISIYYADNTYKSFILIDTYRDPTDQLDFILVCIRCDAEKGGNIRQYAHEFYINRCKYNLLYAEGNSVILDHYNTDFSLFKRSVKSHFKKNNNNTKIHFYKSGCLI